jgi:hypothetical protein
VPAASVPFDTLAVYDAAHIGARRDAFLRSWLALAGRSALVSIGEAVADGDPSVRGIGVICPCREGAKIGPLFAEDTKVAESLFRRRV